jgi:cytochrome oxidase Cu insertion factor (SCO1/SenC/PrrC family)
LKLLRNKLFLVAAVCAAPIVLGTAAYLLGWTPGTASNYGELITPRPVPLGELRGKWVLVTFDAAACDAYCEKKLYFMRQVRRAQGKEMDRVERLWVLTDAGKPRAEVVAAIEGTRISDFSPQGFPGNPPDHIYLVDPLGNLMMRFPREPDPSKMIKDLQRLLKYSRIG